jgi:hypothetical protein
LSQMSHYRTTYAPYSLFFVQIASNYVGQWLGRVLPAWKVKVPFTKHGFSLNPGPWSVKEYVLVTISAASGATYNLAYAPISMSELYFNHRINPGVAIVFHVGDRCHWLFVCCDIKAVSTLRSAIPMVSPKSLLKYYCR